MQDLQERGKWNVPCRNVAENDKHVKQLEQVKEESLKNQVNVINDESIAHTKESNNSSTRFSRLEN